MMLTILVTMTVKPQDAAEFDAALDALMPLLRATEPDTHTFNAYRVDKQDGVYRIMEVYASRAALDFHINNPATAAQRGIFQRLLSSPPEILPLTPITGK